MPSTFAYTSFFCFKINIKKNHGQAGILGRSGMINNFFFFYLASVCFFSWRGSFIIGSAEALPILCVRCARREREIQRERERERERVRRKWRHFSSAEIGDEFCTFHCQNAEIGDEFCTFLAKHMHLSFSPSWRALSSHFLLPKTLSSSKQFAFFVLLLSNGVTGDRRTETNDRISGCTVLLLIEKMNQINTQNYWK